MKAGAAEFLTKPFRVQDLLDAIQQCTGIAQPASSARRSTICASVTIR